MLLCLFTDGAVTGCQEGILGSHEFTPTLTSQPCTFCVTRGDYSPLMALVTDNLQKAQVMHGSCEPLDVCVKL